MGKYIPDAHKIHKMALKIPNGHKIITNGHKIIPKFSFSLR
jgi:hypothetical protein